jgi:hypothetical protein
MIRFSVSMFLAILFFAISLAGYGQRSGLVTADGTAQVTFPDFKSRQEVEKEALDLAKIDALEKAFGRVVFQGNSTYVSNVNTGAVTETKSVFNMIGNSYVKGEVIEVISHTCEELTGYTTVQNVRRPYREYKCDVRVRARELTDVPVNFSAGTLALPDKRFITTTFTNENPFYFFFNSPVSGHLSIFYDDNNHTYRLLPYSKMPAKFEGGVPVAANKDYIFFSNDRQFDYFANEPGVIVDSYELYTNQAQEINRIFVLFSREPINNPSLKKEINPSILDRYAREQGYSIPDGLESRQFQDWLQRNRIARNDLQVHIIDITVRR